MINPDIPINMINKINPDIKQRDPFHLPPQLNIIDKRSPETKLRDQKSQLKKKGLAILSLDIDDIDTWVDTNIKNQKDITNLLKQLITLAVIKEKQ